MCLRMWAFSKLYESRDDEGGLPARVSVCIIIDVSWINIKMTLY